MYSTFITSALFASLALQAVADFTINSPTLKQCQKANIEWSGDKGQVLVSVVKANDPCGHAIVDLPQDDGSSLQWTVALPAGTKVQLAAEDDSDDVAWSRVITVDPSDDDSCLPGGKDDKKGDDKGDDNDSGNRASGSPSGSGTAAVIGGTQPVAIVPPAATAGAAASGGSPNATPNGGLGANNVGSLGTTSGALSQMRAPALWFTLVSAALVAGFSL